MTPARRRALEKAAAHGFIMRPGRFCPKNPLYVSDAIKLEQFDSSQVIDRLINGGFLTHGNGANQFVLTAAGLAEIATDGEIPI